MRDLCPPVAPLLRSGVECNALTPRANGLSPSSHRMDPSIFLVCSNRRPPSDVADFSVLDAYCLISALTTRDFHFICAKFVQPQYVYKFHLVLLLLSYSCLSLLLEDRFFESIPQALQLNGVLSQFCRSFFQGNFVIYYTTTLQLLIC